MGKLYLGWGNVRYEQRDLEESSNLHMRALMRYKGTVGEGHNRTGDACVKVSGHHIRYGEYDAAM
jgi:hypothetical protein